MKRCSRCGECKPVDQYQRDKQNRDGLFSWCRPCNTAARRDSQRRRGEMQIEAQRQIEAERRERELIGWREMERRRMMTAQATGESIAYPTWTCIHHRGSRPDQPHRAHPVAVYSGRWQFGHAPVVNARNARGQWSSKEKAS